MADSTRAMRRSIFERELLPVWRNRLLTERVDVAAEVLNTLLDLPAQRRLRDMQRRRRAPEVQPFGDRDEVPQLAQLRGLHTQKVSIIAFHCIGLQ